MASGENLESEVKEFFTKRKESGRKICFETLYDLYQFCKQKETKKAEEREIQETEFRMSSLSIIQESKKKEDLGHKEAHNSNAVIFKGVNEKIESPTLTAVEEERGDIFAEEENPAELLANYYTLFYNKNKERYLKKSEEEEKNKIQSIKENIIKSLENFKTFYTQGFFYY